MINLLPNEEKRQLRAAHINAIVIWYILLAFAGIVFAGGVLGVSYMTLHTTRTVNENLTIKNQTQASSAYGDTQQQATNLASSLASAKPILASEVNYSKLLVDIAGDMPNGTVLSELNITSATISSPTSLQFLASNNTTAQALVAALRSDRALFTRVTLTSMNSGQDAGAYPVTVQLQVAFNRAAVE